MRLLKKNSEPTAQLTSDEATALLDAVELDKERVNSQPKVFPANKTLDVVADAIPPLDIIFGRHANHLEKLLDNIDSELVMESGPDLEYSTEVFTFEKIKPLLTKDIFKITNLEVGEFPIILLSEKTRRSKYIDDAFNTLKEAFITTFENMLRTVATEQNDRNENDRILPIEHVWKVDITVIDEKPPDLLSILIPHFVFIYIHERLLNSPGGKKMSDTHTVPGNTQLIFGSTDLTETESENIKVGDIIIFDQEVDATFDIIKNGKIIAKGTTIISGDNLGCRILKICRHE